jgi:starch synthase
MGLEGLLQSRSEVLHGILNGIDTEAWNPQLDAALEEGYTAGTTERRAANRVALCERFGIDDSPGPLFSVVSRLTWQKGMDMLVESVDQLVAMGGKLVVLGSGDPALENGLKGAAARHPGKVGIIVGYSEELSHLIQGGADVMMVPSRFEPCGLTQLYGLRYGCVPIVARTGGLADTIIDANEAAISAGVATGFQFAPNNGGAMLHAIRRLVDAHASPAVWEQIQRQGMKADVSWDKSADKYVELYRLLLSKRVA